MAAASLHQDILVSPSLVSPSLLSSIRENSGNTRPSACTNRIVEDHTCVLEIYIFLFFSLFSSISFKEDESSSRNRVLVGPVAISLYLKRRPTGPHVGTDGRWQIEKENGNVLETKDFGRQLLVHMGAP